MHVKFCYATKSCVAMIESFRGKHSDNEISVEKDVKKMRGVFGHVLCMLNEF